MRLSCLLPAVLFLLTLSNQSMAAEQDQKSGNSFTFIVFSNALQGKPDVNSPLNKLVTAMAAESVHPAFLIADGDITQSGKEDEYISAKSELEPILLTPSSLYGVPGVDDIRYSPDGKELFTKQFQRAYRSFDFRGVHFILLDSTIILHKGGHFDQSELNWLASDLKRTRPSTPVFLFFFHPLSHLSPSKRPIDNEFDLRNLLKKNNIVAIFQGEPTEKKRDQFDGIAAFSSQGLTHGDYFVVKISNYLAEIKRENLFGKKSDEKAVTLPIAGGVSSELQTAWNDPDVPFLFRRRPAAFLDPRSPDDDPAHESAEYLIDDGLYLPMQRNDRNIWESVFLTGSIPTGVHTCDIKLTSSSKITYEGELIFEVERTHNEPTRKWAINLGDSIMSSPLLYDGTLYVSSMDGKLYAIQPLNSKIKWTYSTRAAIVASPIYADGLIIIGSTDHSLAALNPQDGHVEWKYDTAGPVMETVSAAQNVVCVAAGGKIAGVDIRTGKLLWSHIANGLFQASVGTDGSAFYLGGWNNTLYAIDSKTGAILWKNQTFQSPPALAAPLIYNGRLYVCSIDGTLSALNPQTGIIIWKTRSPEQNDIFGGSSVSVLGLTLYITGKGGKGDVYALDTSTGQIQWTSSIGQKIDGSSPRLSPDGHTLAVMGYRGHVAVLSTDSGKILWSYELGPGNIYSTPDYDGNHIFTVTMADDVQCINGPGVR